MIVKEYFLKGLDCANCANKIEAKIKSLNNVIEVNLNFINLTLKITTNKNQVVSLNEIKEIVNNYEPSVVVIEKQKEKNLHKDSEEIEDNRKILFRLAIGSIIFFVSIFLKLEGTIKAIAFIISYLLIGYDILILALKNILKGQIFDENFLMSIASLGAMILGDYPESVAVMLFYRVGEYFQNAAVDKSRRSIKKLMDIKPDHANLVDMISKEVKVVSPYEVKQNDIIQIKPGEKIPVDAIIIEGKSTLDTTALTGESIPREVFIGDSILSGMININGLLLCKVTKEFNESTVSKILDLVENATSKKSVTENFITTFAKYYTPIVVIIAFLIAVINPFLGGSLYSGIHKGLVFLVISCPCALVISIPLGFFGGIGASSKNGILIKGSNYLEALYNVKTIVFDKTGTLTKGSFNVTKIESFNNFTKEDVLKFAAYAENFSSHPIALSIKKAYNKPIEKNVITNYNEDIGFGINVNVGKKAILAGNQKLMDKHNIKYPIEKTNGTIVNVSIDNIYAGYIIISDELKPDSKKTIEELKKVGIKNIVMLSGDNKKAAEDIASSLGINSVYAELLPNDKVNVFENILKNQKPNEKTAFIGDGINDAPVLRRADIGIAMGGVGSDAAIESADIVFMTDEPSKLITAINISKATRNIVLQNIIFALSIKFIILILGLFSEISMWAAVFADVGVALLAIFNSMRILNKK